ncbi:MAG TPA: F0F1 ATP synthase subunit epsilon [Candidatus Desulfovibrio intestinipullorum]|uniref:ATP synthase epsilon chain n=1 Tax=Candidatus Desulfovibrio intestinipullorum TaxID=2838536 RepID=A0A9D1TRB2_9BACT|nr:F0F1 ATP synthase subunit epsilon [Candidatus Desulfovibrio intestinipullorum]
MSELTLEVVTPDKTVLSTPVVAAVCPGAAGEFGVLKNHISLLSALKIGALRYRTESNEEHLVFVNNGFADVNNNVLTVLVESAELAENIDIARAEAAKKRAEDRLADKSDKIDHVRAEAALQRALVRLSLARHH